MIASLWPVVLAMPVGAGEGGGPCFYFEAWPAGSRPRAGSPGYLNKTEGAKGAADSIRVDHPVIGAMAAAR